ncbi:MAG: class I SAM-dependent methyltransferase [Methanomassiliicoccaceae archaeon]|nr:class I SAM-dependent methyltransferase [Methanomassiliicoccaceae archaeon]
MGFKEYWGRQAGNPTGIGGRIVTFVINRMNRPMYDAVLEHIENCSDVLDIGFGNGYMFKRSLKISDSKFYGIDISHDMVKLASKKNKKAVRDGRLVLAEASVDDIPFDNGFDLIYTINTVYFWNDLHLGLETVYGKLKENGIFLNVCYTKKTLESLGFTQHYRKYTEEELSEAAREAGFDAETIPIEEGRSFFLRAIKRTRA